MDEAAGEVRVGCPAEQGARGLIAAGLAHAPTRTACETWAKATFSRENSITRARSPSAVGRGERHRPLGSASRLDSLRRARSQAAWDVSRLGGGLARRLGSRAHVSRPSSHSQRTGPTPAPTAVNPA